MNAALLVAPDFLLIALGALLARRFAYGPAFWEGVERLVYFVLFPALLFRSLATAPLALSDRLFVGPCSAEVLKQRGIRT